MKPLARAILIVLPAHDAGGPSESGAEGDEQHVVAGFDDAGAVGFVEGDGAGGGAGVTEFVDIGKGAFFWDAEAVSGGIDDADVGLMGDDDVDVRRFQAGEIDGPGAGGGDVGDGGLECLLALHVDGIEMQMSILSGDGKGGAASGNIENVGQCPIGPHHGDQHLWFMYSLVGAATAQNGGSSSVAKKHTRVAVAPVDDARKFFRSDDQGRFSIAGIDEMPTDLHRIQKPGTGRRDVKSDRIFGSQIALHITRRGGENRIGRDGGDDDQLDLGRCDAGHFHGPAGGHGRHVGRRLAGRGNPALFDAGPGGDPFIAGLD